jgi:hypothetical protein
MYVCMYVCMCVRVCVCVYVYQYYTMMNVGDGGERYDVLWGENIIKRLLPTRTYTKKKRNYISLQYVYSWR